MEQAGIDVISDGEQGRESYFNRFANALGGIDPERPGRAIARLGRPTPVPRVVGPIERVRPVSVPEATFLRSVTDRRQLRELEPIVDGLQLDEPYLQAHPDRARAYGIAAIDRALAGLVKPTCIHLCFGYAFFHALAGSTKSGDYRFLTELERSAATQVSIEAAQPRLDLGVLAGLPSRRSCSACSTSATRRRRPRTRSRAGWRPRSSTSRPRAWWPHPTAA
jgi:5-methyltetrahydropteroyltriglutamate--homocysteine methyltransferase